MACGAGAKACAQARVFSLLPWNPHIFYFKLIFWGKKKVLPSICPCEQQIFSWLKKYFYNLNVQVKVIFLQVKYFAVAHGQSLPVPPSNYAYYLSALPIQQANKTLLSE